MSKMYLGMLSERKKKEAVINGIHLRQAKVIRQEYCRRIAAITALIFAATLVYASLCEVTK